MSQKHAWASYGITRCSFEILRERGHEVEWYPSHPPNGYDLVLYMTSAKTPDAETCKRLSRGGAKVFVFGLSDPTMFRPFRLKNCDTYFSNDLLTVDANPGSIWYPSSCDIRYHVKLNIPKEYDCIFIGNANHKYVKTRQRVIDSLRKHSIRVVTYGKGWAPHKDSHSYIMGDDMIRAINKARLCIDITSESASLGHRIFECSCCGVPVLTRARPDVERLFVPDEEILLYAKGLLLPSLERALSDPQRLLSIGRAARERCIKEHDITKRVSSILSHYDLISAQT